MTIKDIAREAGVAVGTASRVLNNNPNVSDETRKKVMEVVRKYNFRLNSNAKHLKQQNNDGIAIIVKGTKNMLFADLVETLQGMIKDRGFACLIYYIDEEEDEVQQAIQICIERLPMGILFLGSNLENFRKGFANINIPCVMVTNAAETLGFENLSSVSIDDGIAAKTVVEYLIDSGHRRIGILGGEMEYENPAKRRYAGCESAFERHGILFSPEIQFEQAYFSMESGYEAMLRLLDKMPDVTAVFAISDVMALGAIRAIRDRGLRVPEDISVVGFDGIELGQYMVPRLTTIKQPNAEMAERCVELLLHCISKKTAARYERIPFEFWTGETTKVIDKECETICEKVGF